MSPSWRKSRRGPKSPAIKTKSVHPSRGFAVPPPFSMDEAIKIASSRKANETLSKAEPQDYTESTTTTAMLSVPQASDSFQSRFFQLPRELRDKIYMHYCYPSPRKDGPLENYTEVPSSAPLAVSKQMRAELAPIYYESLKHTLVQDQVCLKLRSNNSPGYSRYAGWNIWRFDWESSSCCFNVWVRDGTDEDDYAAFWVDALNLCSLSEFAKFRTPLGGAYASHVFDQLVHALEILMTTPSMFPISLRVRRRLYGVINKVQRNLKDLRDREAKASAKTPDRNSPYGAVLQSTPVRRS